MALEDEVRESNNLLRRFIEGQTNTRQQYQRPPGTDRAGVDQDNGNILRAGMNNILASVGQVTQGTYGLANATGDVSKILSGFGAPGGALAEFGSGVLGIAVDTNKYMMEASKSGYGFNQNLGLFAKSVLGAQMSLPDFDRMIKESGKALGGLAGSASNSAIAYLEMLRETNDNQDVIGGRLSGIDNFDKTLLISASASKNQSMLDIASRKLVVDSGVQMAIEFDNIARITGKSRQEQEKDVQTQLSLNETKVALLAMTGEEQAAYQDNLTKMGKYGASFQELTTELAVGKGDVLGKKGNEQSASLEVLAPGIVSLMQAQAKNTGMDSASIARRDRIQAEIDQKMVIALNNKENLSGIAQRGRIGENAVSQETVRAAAGTEAIAALYQKLLKEAGGDASRVKAITDEQLAEFKKNRLPPGAPGTPGYDPASAASKSMIGADLFFKQVSSGWGATLDTLNTKTGTFISQLPELEKLFKARSQAEMEVLGNINDLAKKLGYTGVDITKEGAVSERNTSRVLPRRAEGGRIERGKDYFVGERGFELFRSDVDGEITPNNILTGMIPQLVNQLPNLLNGLQSELRVAQTEAKKNAPSMDGFQQIFNKIGTVSSSSNGANTTSAASGGGASDAESAMIKGIDQLNTKMKELIDAVTDGTSKNVKAVKSTGNML